MFHTIQWRIAFGFIIIIVLGMAALGSYLTVSAHNDLLDNLRSELHTEADIVAQASRPFLQDGDLAGLTGFVNGLGEDIEARVTVVRMDGTVLADSQEDAASLANHAGRPEIMQALETGYGEATRTSPSTGERMLYVAVPITGTDGTLGTARVALDTERVEAYTGTMVPITIVSIICATVAVIVAAWFITRLTMRPIRELTFASRELAAGNFDYRVPFKSGDESGQLARAFQDMSDRLKDLVQNLSDDKARLSTILDNMADGIITTDQDTNVVLMNQAAGRLLGIPHGEAAGRPLIESARDYQLNDILKRCLKSGKSEEAQFEAGVSGRFLRAIAVPMPAETGGALLLLQDLTELRGLQTMRREIVGNISHDFRTPLAGIKAMVNTLQDGAVNDAEAAADFLARIEDEVDRLTQMVTELTELSRIETGRSQLKIAPVNINDLVRDGIIHLGPQAERQKLALTVDLQEDLPVVRIDAERIRQVIINLMHNAIKFNKPEGSVTVATRLEEDAVVVSVSDTGIGIAPGDLPRIFERFFKADRSRAGLGSGMGLAIAKHTVESHGGTIKVRSEPGKGSTFTFRLPLNRRPG